MISVESNLIQKATHYKLKFRLSCWISTTALTESGGQSGVVNIISTGFLGNVGAVLTLLGVVACPITLGDTAFRSARFRIADALRIKQDVIVKHSFIAIGYLFFVLF